MLSRRAATLTRLQRYRFINDDVADVDADAKLDLWFCGTARFRSAIPRWTSTHRVPHPRTGKLDQHAVACGLDDPAR